MKIDIFIPSSFTSNLHSLLQRSFVVASLARAAAIFGVDTIYVYPDPINRYKEPAKQMIKILRYLTTAPYLRKVLFPLDRDLEYVGLLPPLRTPLHKEKVPIKELSFPEYREGVVLRSFSDKSIVDVGLDKYVSVKGRLPLYRSVIVKIMKSSSTYLHGEVVNRNDVPEYPGYKVVNIKTKLPSLLESYKGKVVITSRKGRPIHEVSEELIQILRGSERIGLVFGGPEYGLFEILEHYGYTPYDFTNLVINFIPNQNVKTVRVEEAVMISLSITNYLYLAKR